MLRARRRTEDASAMIEYEIGPIAPAETNNTETSLGIVGSLGLGDRSADAENEEKDDVDGGTSEVDCSATEVAAEGPGADVRD